MTAVLPFAGIDAVAYRVTIMKPFGVSVVLFCLLAAVFAGCLSPEEEGEVEEDPWLARGYHPLDPSFENPKPDVTSGFESVARLLKDDDEPWPTGSGNWVQGDLVFASSLSQAFYIADISDPEDPKILWSTDDPEGLETPYARKAEVVNHPDGRMTLALATQRDGMHLWNVTDPENPEWAASLPELDPNHYVAAVPGLEVVVNNPSTGAGNPLDPEYDASRHTNQFVDVSDPYNPVILGDFGGAGCHGTVFLNEYGHDKFRGYCAGIDRTEIWDMTGWDPEAQDLGIQVLGVVDELDDPVAGNPLLRQHPMRALHHLATANDDGTILVIGDEHNGGGSPGACFYNDGDHSTPFGALWFYDVSDESDPQLLSWISPPTVEPVPTRVLDDPANPWPAVPNCTAHFGEVIEGENKIVIAWYSAGVLLVSFEDPENPVILDQFQPEGTGVWSARYHNGYVFTSDMGRGMDVLKLV